MPCLCYFETQNVISKWAGTPWTVSSRRRNKRPDCIERERVGNKNRPNTLTRKQKKMRMQNQLFWSAPLRKSTMAAHGPILNRNGVKLGRVNVPFKPETFYLKHLCFIRAFPFLPSSLGWNVRKTWRSNYMLPNCKDRTVGVTKSSSLRSLAELIQNKAKAKSINKYAMSYHISRSFISLPKVGKYLTSEVPKKENAVQWGKQ